MPKDCKLLICLDANAHTNITNDYIGDTCGTDAGLNNLIFINESISNSIPDDIINRYSMDQRPVNEHGKNLLELCRACNVFIANGRLGDDCGKGNITWVDKGGMGHCGVIDYMLLSPSLYEDVCDFRVHGMFPESDHAPLEISIKCNTNFALTDNVNPTWKSHYKYV